MENELSGKKICGRVWKYGDDVNTDVIYPGRFTYLMLSEEEMASHALEDLDPDFAEQMQCGDILVGGWNWGVGSAREQAVKCLKAKGVGAVIAKSFARIYFRNCLNEGLYAIACPEAAEAVQKGETVAVDFENSRILASGKTFSFEKYPDYVLGLVEAGGIIPYTKKKMQEKGKTYGENGSDRDH